MRTLTKKQKRFLDMWYNQNKNQILTGIIHFDLETCDLFPLELLVALREINDTEILVQEINEYIQDKGMKK